MDEVDALARKWPAQAWTIQRLFLRDAEFRALVEDFRDATDAAVYWQEAEGAADKRSIEFCELAGELEQAILRYADRANRSI